MPFTWTEEDYEKYKRRLQGPTKPPAPKPPAPKPPKPKAAKQKQRKSSTADLKKRLAY